jgi:hypothetical protein
VLSLENSVRGQREMIGRQKPVAEPDRVVDLLILSLCGVSDEEDEIGERFRSHESRKLPCRHGLGIAMVQLCELYWLALYIA